MVQDSKIQSIISFVVSVMFDVYSFMGILRTQIMS